MHTCRQTFEFYKFIDRGKSKKISNMSRADLGIIMRYTTGHAHLLRHNKITGTLGDRPIRFPLPQYKLNDPDDGHIGKEDIDIRCRLCDLRGSEETPFHILKDCLAVWRERRDYFGTYTFEGTEFIDWSPEALVGYFKKLDLENKA